MIIQDGDISSLQNEDEPEPILILKNSRFR